VPSAASAEWPSRRGAAWHAGREPRLPTVAADITAIVLTVACAAIAGWCGRLVLRLWRAGPQPPGRRAQPARERSRP
jgi:hypothetical protein